MWLTDEEIQAHIDAGTQERFCIAIDALYGRYEFGDPVRVTPLTADLLKCCTEEIPRQTIYRFLDFVIGVEEIPSLPTPDNWREVMKSVCLYLGTTGAFSTAMVIKINRDGPALVALSDSNLRSSPTHPEISRDQISCKEHLPRPRTF